MPEYNQQSTSINPTFQEEDASSPFIVMEDKEKQFLLLPEHLIQPPEDLAFDKEIAMATLEMLCGFKWNPLQWSEVAHKIQKICLIHGDRLATAERSTEGQTIDPCLYTRDMEGIQRAGTLEKYITERQQLNIAHGFNSVVCDRMFANDIEYERLKTLATEGATIDVADEFVACSTPEPLRSIWAGLPNTLSWHINKLWKNNKIIVVPISDEIKAYKPHISPLWWVEQDPIIKPEGRFLGDLSNRESGSALNSEEAKEIIKTRYGELNHPSIIDILTSICELAEQCGGFDSILLWKEDISGAFTHFYYKPSQAKWLSFAMSQTYILIFIMGMFGWSGSPYVFGVFSRAILRYILARIDGKCHVYCDDFIGASPVNRALADSLISQQAIESCFGEGTAAKDKRVTPCVDTDIIGWQVNIMNITIRPNYKGIKSLTRSFCSVSLSDKISTKHYQTMASLACRYSMCLRGMRPFVRPLFLMCHGRRHQRRKPSTAAKIAIIMWQTVTTCLLCSPDRLALDIRSVVKMPTTNIIHAISDAGPSALGLALYNHNRALLGYLSYTFPFEARDPKYQNGREYMAILMIKIILIGMGYASRETTCSVNWTGDNRSSLAWARRTMCTSISAQRVFMAESWISTLANIQTFDTIHKAGVDMGAIDDLSRNKQTDFDPKYDLKRYITPSVDKLFQFCDPTCEISHSEPSLEGHKQLLVLLNDILDK